MAASFFFISAPGEPSRQDTFANLQDRVASRQSDLAELFQFSLPDFKIGTLDQLVVLSDDLAKADSSIESIVNKLSENLKSLFQNDLNQWKAALVVNDKTVDSFLKSFQWNSMKYRTDKSLRELSDSVIQEVSQIDNLMKTKMSAYNSVKSQLSGLQRKQVGNLSTRSLADVVKKEYFVLDSEYLATILVAVNKTSTEAWLAKFETLTQMVVPRSTQKIAEDDDYSLWTVTLFQRVVDEYMNKCRVEKFIPRDFKWDEEQIKKEKKEFAEMGASEKELWTQLVRLGKTNFGEVFSCWVHLKALRVYVESILRYGLPPNFQPMIIKPKAKSERKLKEVLATHYARLGGAAAGNKDDPVEENVQLLLGDKDYYPYVHFGITF